MSLKSTRIRCARHSVVLITSAIALAATPAVAQVNTFTIRDGGCTYNLTNAIGNRIGGAAGLADLRTATNDHLFQNWFWYRSNSDTREYALANQSFFNSVAINEARLRYLEPVADGAVANALLFDLEYTISDLSPSFTGVASAPVCVRCEVVITIKVRNLTPVPVNLQLFAYNDMDLNSSSSGDNAFIAGGDNQVQMITDAGPGGTGCRVDGVFKVSSTDHTAWQIGAFPNIRARLDDAAANVLLNTVSPFTGDYTGAQQWSITLGPAGSVAAAPFDEWVGSVVKEVTVHIPGDLDGDCDVDLGDLAGLLSVFGTVCMP